MVYHFVGSVRRHLKSMKASPSDTKKIDNAAGSEQNHGADSTSTGLSVQTLPSTVHPGNANYKKNQVAIPPDAAMAERVSRHHWLIHKITNFLIHPTIERQLPVAARIADLNTGTGVFLQHLQGDMKKKKYELVGYDTMPEIFPGKQSAPYQSLSNARFVKHFILQPYPAWDHEYYDSVHANFLGPVLVAEQWEEAFDNMMTLVKPGGWVQWIDVDLSNRQNKDRIYVSKTGSSKASYVEMMEGIAELNTWYGEEVGGGKRLKEIAEKHPDVAVASVHEDMFNTAQLNNVRVQIDELSVLAWERLLHHVADLPNSDWTEERVNRVKQGMVRECKDGVYIPLAVYVVIAQKESKEVLQKRRLREARETHRVAKSAWLETGRNLNALTGAMGSNSLVKSWSH